MEKYSLSDFKGGWFLGDFYPSIFRTKHVEVSVKRYKKGQKEDFHYHNIATEFTVIIRGKVKMSNQIYVSGDIIKIAPGVSTNFEALTQAITVVVKLPSVADDKYQKNSL